MAALTKEQVYKLALNRMNYTWEPDEAQSANVNAAIEEAEALLRARAGSPDLDLTGISRLADRMRVVSGKQSPGGV